MWYKWTTLEDFNTWHNNLCVQLGYPLTPVNQATGLPDETAQKVISYTEAIAVDDGVIAWVDEEYSTGLIETTPPIFKSTGGVL